MKRAFFLVGSPGPQFDLSATLVWDKMSLPAEAAGSENAGRQIDMVRRRVLLAAVVAAGLMCLGFGFELGQRCGAEKPPQALSVPWPEVAADIPSLPCEPPEQTKGRPRTIRVRDFKNAVDAKWAEEASGVERELTEEVVRTLVCRTPYKVVAKGEADMELTGTITQFFPLAREVQSGSCEHETETILVVEVNWREGLTGESMLPPVYGVRPASSALESVAYFRPEVGEPITTARTRNVKEMTNKILALLEIP